MSFIDGNGNALGIVDILQKLKDQFGDTLTVAESDALKKAFGSDEAVALIKQMLPDVDGLAASINNVGQQTGMDKATQMASSMTDQWDRLGAAWFALRAGAGASVLPTINEVVGVIVDAIAVLTEWTQMFPHLTEVVTWVAIGLASLTAVAASWTLIMGVGGSMMAFYGGAMSGLTGIMKLLRIGFILTRTAQLAWIAIQGIAAAGTFLLTGAFSALGVAVAFVFSPFFLIIAALAAVAIGTVWLARNWEMVSAKLMEVPFVKFLINAFKLITDGWKSFMDTLANLGPIKLIGSAINWLIEKINLIPGINIDLGGDIDMPDVPDVPQVAQQTQQYTGGSNVGGSMINTNELLLPSMVPESPLANTPQTQPYITDNPSVKSKQIMSGINEQLRNSRTSDPVKAPSPPLMPQMAKVANQNSGKSVHFGDVHIKNEQGMDPAAMAEWEELQHGF